jgi:hypothetical protein
MDKNPHPHIFIYYDIVINITIEGCKVLLCSNISLPSELRQLLKVATSWKGIKRLR